MNNGRSLSIPTHPWHIRRFACLRWRIGASTAGLNLSTDEVEKDLVFLGLRP